MEIFDSLVVRGSLVVARTVLHGEIITYHRIFVRSDHSYN